MEIVHSQNFARQNIVFSNKYFIECNFSQSVSNTLLNIKNSRFENCNLVNCDLDLSNETIDCNTAQVESLDG